MINPIHRSFAKALANVTVRMDIPPFTLDIEPILLLGLMISELVSNSFKHAFSDRGFSEEKKKIWVAMALNVPDDLRLEVGDSDDGLSDEVDLDQSPSMGLQLVRSLVTQLQGRLTVERYPGTRLHILISKPKVFLVKEKASE